LNLKEDRRAKSAGLLFALVLSRLPYVLASPGYTLIYRYFVILNKGSRHAY